MPIHTSRKFLFDIITVISLIPAPSVPVFQLKYYGNLKVLSGITRRDNVFEVFVPYGNYILTSQPCKHDTIGFLFADATNLKHSSSNAGKVRSVSLSICKWLITKGKQQKRGC